MGSWVTVQFIAVVVRIHYGSNRQLRICRSSLNSNSTEIASVNENQIDV